MCYSNFEDIVDMINDFDVDVIIIEYSRSYGGFLDYLKDYLYLKGFGFGVYDIYSFCVLLIEEMYNIIVDVFVVCLIDCFWVNLDCGLKIRQQEEMVVVLKNMVEVVKQVRVQQIQFV